MSQYANDVAVWAGGFLLAGAFLALFAGPAIYGIWRGRSSPMLTAADPRLVRTTAWVCLPLGLALIAAVGAATDGWIGAAAAVTAEAVYILAVVVVILVVRRRRS
jgi:hypothetical membrane protein